MSPSVEYAAPRLLAGGGSPHATCRAGADRHRAPARHDPRASARRSGAVLPGAGARAARWSVDRRVRQRQVLQRGRRRGGGGGRVGAPAVAAPTGLLLLLLPPLLAILELLLLLQALALCMLFLAQLLV